MDSFIQPGAFPYYCKKPMWSTEQAVKDEDLVPHRSRHSQGSYSNRHRDVRDVFKPVGSFTPSTGEVARVHSVTSHKTPSFYSETLYPRRRPEQSSYFNVPGGSQLSLPSDSRRNKSPTNTTHSLPSSSRQCYVNRAYTADIHEHVSEESSSTDSYSAINDEGKNNVPAQLNVQYDNVSASTSRFHRTTDETNINLLLPSPQQAEPPISRPKQYQFHGQLRTPRSYAQHGTAWPNFSDGGGTSSQEDIQLDFIGLDDRQTVSNGAPKRKACLTVTGWKILALISVLISLCLTGAVVALTLNFIKAKEGGQQVVSGTTSKPDEVDVVMFNGSMRIRNMTYGPEYKDKTSDKYKSTSVLFCSKVQAVYNNSDLKDSYQTCQVIAYRNGSVIVDFELTFNFSKGGPQKGAVIQVFRDNIGQELAKDNLIADMSSLKLEMKQKSDSSTKTAPSSTSAKAATTPFAAISTLMPLLSSLPSTPRSITDQPTSIWTSLSTQSPTKKTENDTMNTLTSHLTSTTRSSISTSVPSVPLQTTEHHTSQAFSTTYLSPVTTEQVAIEQTPTSKPTQLPTEASTIPTIPSTTSNNPVTTTLSTTPDNPITSPVVATTSTFSPTMFTPNVRSTHSHVHTSASVSVTPTNEMHKDTTTHFLPSEASTKTPQNATTVLSHAQTTSSSATTTSRLPITRSTSLKSTSGTLSTPTTTTKASLPITLSTSSKFTSEVISTPLPTTQSPSLQTTLMSSNKMSTTRQMPTTSLLFSTLVTSTATVLTSTEQTISTSPDSTLPLTSQSTSPPRSTATSVSPVRNTEDITVTAMLTTPSDFCFPGSMKNEEHPGDCTKFFHFRCVNSRWRRYLAHCSLPDRPMFDPVSRRCVRCTSSCKKCSRQSARSSSESTENPSLVSDSAFRLTLSIGSTLRPVVTTQSTESAITSLPPVQCVDQSDVHNEPHPYRCSYGLICFDGETHVFDCNSSGSPDRMYSASKASCVKCDPEVCDECT